jgi:tetratricopeptide (TPR) repeat protein
MKAASPRAPFAPLSDKVDRVLSLVLSSRERHPAEHLPKRLHGLFRELGKDAPANDPDDIEDLIWALWISHPDTRAAQAMNSACEAMAAGALDLAKPILDRLVEEYPDWPEAWNKRAILSFIAHDDEACLADMARTLELEPRHFGAISGFAQLCVRRSQPIEAKAALEIALGIDPHLRGLRELMTTLKAPSSRLLN